jgi:hypothetical protein
MKKSKLRNSHNKRLQQQPLEKVNEVSNLPGNVKSELKAKEFTLGLAGSWQDIDDTLFEELTEKLRSNGLTIENTMFQYMDIT